MRHCDRYRLLALIKQYVEACNGDISAADQYTISAIECTIEQLIDGAAQEFGSFMCGFVKNITPEADA